MREPHVARATQAAGMGRGRAVAARLIVACLLAFYGLLRRCGETRALWLARIGCRVLVRLARPAREHNLALLNPAGALTAGNREQVERACREYSSRLHVNLAWAVRETPQGLLGKVTLRGIDSLHTALAEQRGVLVLSAHMGTWWHVPGVLGALGHPTTAVLYPELPAPVLRFAETAAKRFDVTVALVGQGAQESLRDALRAGRICYVACDVNLRPRHGLWFPLGARGALALDSGPAILALRHRTPVVWVDTWHDADGRSCLKFHPALHVGRGTPFVSAESLLRELAQRIEAQVLRRPHQWWGLSFRFLAPAAEVLAPRHG